MLKVGNMETVSAANLIEILQACSANTSVPLDKLPVMVIDHYGNELPIDDYQTILDPEVVYLT